MAGSHRSQPLFTTDTDLKGNTMYDQMLLSRRPKDGIPQTPVALSAYGRRACFVFGQQVYDFSPKAGDLVMAEIMAPAAEPPWIHDPERLWRAAELAESFPEGILASRFLLSLPDRCAVSQAVGLVRDFVAQELLPLGMVIDLAVHAPAMLGRAGGPHAHLVATTRELAPWGFGKIRLDWFSQENRARWQAEWLRRISLQATKAA